MNRYKNINPHLIPGTDVLKNRFGITGKEDLKRLEGNIVLHRAVTAPDGDLSVRHLKEIHSHLFGPLYEWAGEFRNLPTAKGVSRWCQP